MAQFECFGLFVGNLFPVINPDHLKLLSKPATNNSRFTMKCIVCDQLEWTEQLNAKQMNWDRLVLDISIDEALEPVHKFQAILSHFASSCANCSSCGLICLMGRTGAGKSTILNILAGCKPSLETSNLGTKQIYFKNGVCEVGGGLSSLTKFCFFHRIDDNIYVDFAGFFDNRAGQLQIVQHLLLHYVTSRRKYKIISVKDIRTSRDSHFFDFLNRDWILESNTVVVMTHTMPDNKIKWKKYSEGRVTKNLKVILFPLAADRDEVKSFRNELQRALKYLEFSCDKRISLEVSSDVFKFQSEATIVIQAKLDEAFQKILQNTKEMLIQPYDIPYYRTLFSAKYTTEEAVQALQEGGVIMPHTDTKVLSDLIRHWKVLSGISGKTDRMTWGQLSPSSNEIINEFYRRLDSFNPPDFIGFEGKDLIETLREWNRLCHCHYLEHVAYRLQALALIAKGDARSFQELERLAKYRQQVYRNIAKVWSPIEKRVMEAIELDDVMSPEGKVFRALRMKDAQVLIVEIARFSNTNDDDLAKLFKNLSRYLTGFAMADGAVATTAWAASSAGIGTTALIDISPALGYTAQAMGSIFAVASVAAIGAYAFHLYLLSRQLQKIRSIGIDLSFLRVEAAIWNRIEQYAKNKNSEGVKKELALYDKEFRLYMNSTSKGVQKAKMRLAQAQSGGVDISAWNKLITKIDQMSHGIFMEMKARENAPKGCFFNEHEFVSRALMDFQLFTSSACCTSIATRPSYICQNCGLLSHKSQECLLLAYQTACSPVIKGQESKLAELQPKLRNMLSMRKVVDEEKALIDKNEEIILASLLSTAINDGSAKEDEETFFYEIDKVKFLIHITGSTAFVIVRGNEPKSLKNWITNEIAPLAVIKEEEPCKVNLDYLRYCELVYPVVWAKISGNRVNHVVFGGFSMGGAIAHVLHFKSILERRMEQNGITGFSVGFGSPMIFDLYCVPTLKKYGGNLLDFITFAREYDPVPSPRLIAKRSGSSLKDQEYVPFGKYVFFDGEKDWSTSNTQAIMSRLSERNLKGAVEVHEALQYHQRLVNYLGSLEAKNDDLESTEIEP
jgi:GTP-binding protein EngB required for normal cell division